MNSNKPQTGLPHSRASHPGSDENPVNSMLICQGELAVSGDPGVVMSAVLGSCVATCLWDPESRIGGMNHILLPGARADSREGNKYGVYAMEALINELMKSGARKTKLVAKIFGGARTFDNGLRIGEANQEFVQGFLMREDIPILAESLGGDQARRVKFFPESGRARQLLNGETAPLNLTAARLAADTAKAALPKDNSGELELF